jgi:hypothetical protein
VEIYELDERKRKPRSVDDDFIADVKSQGANAAAEAPHGRGCPPGGRRRRSVIGLRLPRHVHGGAQRAIREPSD